MASKMVRQTKFTLGEVDVINWKRTDNEGYLEAAQALTNCEIITTGGATKRKGTKFDLNVTAYAENESQGYQFQDKNGNYYAVILKQEQFDIFKIIDGIVTFYQVVTENVNYLSSELNILDYTQINDVIVFAHNAHPPSRLYISDYSDPVNPVFSFAPLVIFPPPAYDFGTINYNDYPASLIIAGTDATLTLTSASNPGWTTEWINGQVIGAGPSVDNPIGYFIITNVVPWNGLVTVFTGVVYSQMQTEIFFTKGNQFSIKQPVFTDDLGYPGSVLFYQSRLWLGNTPSLNNTVFGSKINAPVNYDVGTGRDIDAIIYTIGESDSGKITALNGGKQLEVYAENYEFVCPQGQDAALTPSTFAIRQQSTFGSSMNIKPISYLNDSYFISKTGAAIINFHFDGIGQSYTGSNISVQSQHLIGKPNNRAILRGDDSSQDNFVYYLNSTATDTPNTITALQFAQEYKLSALTPITFNSELRPNNTVRIIDIFTINNTVYMIKKYLETGEFTLEHFDRTIYMDSVRSKVVDIDIKITGLNDLIGYTVQVVSSGQDYGSYLVNEDGEITVNGLEFGSLCQVGLLYDVAIVPMYVYSGENQSNFYKNISRIFVDYYQSLDFYVNGHLVPYQTFELVQAGLPPVPVTDTAIVSSVQGWRRYSTLEITQSSPFPLTITSIAYQIDSNII